MLPRGKATFYRFLLIPVSIYYRDIYYTDVQIFGRQEVSNRAIENIASMLGIPRSQLHVVLPNKWWLERLIEPEL